MERIEFMHCICEQSFKSFEEDPSQVLIIRRYVGAKGHLVDIGYHEKCYLKHEFFFARLGFTSKLEDDNGT